MVSIRTVSKNKAIVLPLMEDILSFLGLFLILMKKLLRKEIEMRRYIEKL